MTIVGGNVQPAASLRWLSTALLTVLCACAFVGMAPVAAQVASVRHFHVVRYKSITFASPTPFASAIAGNLEIADVLPMSDRQLYIQGKRVGTTNVTLYDQDKHFVAVIDLDVTLDVDDITRRIHAGTESRGIRVSVSKDQIILSGEARNAVDAERAVAIAKSMVTTDDGKEVDPKDADKYVINAMRVAASQQVDAQSSVRRSGPQRRAKPGGKLVRGEQGADRGPEHRQRKRDPAVERVNDANEWFQL